MEWWRDEAGHALMRDYFRVESRDGVRVWLYREGRSIQEDDRRAGSCTACSHEQCRRVSRQDEEDAANAGQPLAPAYAELAVTTNFSFLRGASHPEGIHPPGRGLASPASASRTATALRAWCAPIMRSKHGTSIRGATRTRHRRRRPEARRRRTARVRRRHAGHPRLSAKPQGLGPSHAPAHRRQEPRREGRMHPVSRRPARAHRRPQPHRDAACADQGRCASSRF